VVKMLVECIHRTLPYLRQHLTWPTSSSQEFPFRAHVVILQQILYFYYRVFESSRKLQKRVGQKIMAECISKLFGVLCTHVLWGR